jgi:hypothetical protein
MRLRRWIARIALHVPFAGGFSFLSLVLELRFAPPLLVEMRGDVFGRQYFIPHLD